MSFIESYKRLDNLCKDLFMSETGVTTYIYNMEYIMYPRFQIINWDSDYKKLKQYRYIRNQIVHENSANEANLCNENDLQWIEQFYQRIIHRTDPLALYQEAEMASQLQTSNSQRIKRATQPSCKSKTKMTIWEKILSLFCR